MTAPVAFPVSSPAPAPRAPSDRVSMLNAVMTILGVAGACLVVLMTALIAQISGDELSMVALAMVMTIVFTVPILIDRARPPAERHMLISLCALGHWAYFAVPVFTQYFFLDVDSDGFTRLRNIAPPVIVQGQIAVIVAVVSMYVGYFYPLSATVGRALPKPIYEWPHNTAIIIAVLTVGIGWTITIGSQLGFIPRSFGSGALGAVATGSYFGVGLLAILHARFRSRPAISLIWLVIPPAMAIAFLTGSKRFMLAPMMLAALGYYVVNRRIDLRWIVVGLGFVLVLYPISQFWREIVLAGNQLGMGDVLQNPARALSLISSFASTIDPGDYFLRGLQSTTARLDALGIVATIVRDTPGRVDYQGGWTLLHVPISFIPRVIWADKPLLSIGQWITDNYGAGGDIRSNTGSSWIGEFYLNFGYAGVIVGMGVIGAYFRFLHEMFFRVNTVPAQLSCLVILWATCTTIEMNLIAPFNGVIFTLFLVFFGHLAARMFGGARPGANDQLAPAAASVTSEFSPRLG